MTMKILRFALVGLVLNEPSRLSTVESLAPPVVHLAASRPAVEQSATFVHPSIFDPSGASFIRDWLLVQPASAAEMPSDEQVDLLRQAMAAFYNPDKDFVKAQDLLTQAIAVWKNQPADEVAALYRVRGDCFMALLKPMEAKDDYSKAIELLLSPGGDAADPNELPACYLARGRAIRSTRSTSDAKQAANDYQMALRLSSREDWDTNAEQEEDGAARNPYAAWEWGMELRAAGQLEKASEAHALASQAFTDIGDKARAVIAELDAGIDLAGTSNLQDTKSVLERAIAKTTSVEGRDVQLLQRVIAKEGEGRIALASALWSSAAERPAAEAQLGEACVRLDQLDADATSRNTPSSAGDKLKFSIDDEAGAYDISCARFKNEKFLTETLQWPSSLTQKVDKLTNLKSK